MDPRGMSSANGDIKVRLSGEIPVMMAEILAIDVVRMM